MPQATTGLFLKGTGRDEEMQKCCHQLSWLKAYRAQTSASKSRGRRQSSTGLGGGNAVGVAQRCHPLVPTLVLRQRTSLRVPPLKLSARPATIEEIGQSERRNPSREGNRERHATSTICGNAALQVTYLRQAHSDRRLSSSRFSRQKYRPSRNLPLLDHLVDHARCPPRCVLPH